MRERLGAQVPPPDPDTRNRGIVPRGAGIRARPYSWCERHPAALLAARPSHARRFAHRSRRVRRLNRRREYPPTGVVFRCGSCVVARAGLLRPRGSPRSPDLRCLSPTLVGSIHAARGWLVLASMLARSLLDRVPKPRAASCARCHPSSDFLKVALQRARVAAPPGLSKRVRPLAVGEQPDAEEQLPDAVR